MSKSDKGSKQPRTKVIGSVFRLPFIALIKVLFLVLRPFGPVARPAVKYLRGVRQEFRKVKWPSRRETWKLTLSVVMFSVVFAAFIAVVDYGLSNLFEKLIIKG